MIRISELALHLHHYARSFTASQRFEHFLLALIFPLFLLHTTLASYGQLRPVLSPYIVVYVLAVVGRVR